MTTLYPGALDSLTNPNGTDVQNSPSHAGQHSNANDAIEALEAKVGINGSAVTTSLDYRDQNGMPGVFAGATQATRFVGARASAAPTGNTWALGDFMVLQSGAVAVCTSAGTPGTWVTIGGGTAGMTLPDYIVYKSGATYKARNTTTNADDFSGSDAGAVVQSAHDALTLGGLIELKSSITYTATTQVILSIAGVIVRSHQQVGEDQSTLWQVTSALADGSAAFRVTGSGAGVGGISIDANGNADYCVDMRSAGGFCFEMNAKNANDANIYLDGPNGAQRDVIWNIRSDNPTTQAVRTVTGVVLQSGTIYRFATSAAHHYSVNNVVSLQGFVSSNSVFQNAGVTVPGTVVAVSDSTHFDVDLGASTTFTTSTGTAQRAATNLKFDGPDHIGWGLRTTGAADNGFALWMDTSRMQIASGHITGNGTEFACVQITGSENRISDVYLDTGPNLVNGQAHTIIGGSGNWLSALVQNAATQTAVNVTAVTLQSGTTYRFTCSSAHGYIVGNSVWLEGFAGSSGFFNGNTTGNVLVTAVSDSTHFDADLGSSTTFTDQVGTAKAITKYGVIFKKYSPTAFVQGNELHLNYQGKGANANTGEFYYAVGFLDENYNDVANFARFAGNKLYANAGHATRFSNLEASWGTMTNVDKIMVDAWEYQQDTTTPIPWRTKNSGLTAASTASSWTVTHGLAGLPKNIQFTPAATLTNQVTWVSGVTKTQFVINASASVTNGQFYWMAEM